MRFVIFGGTGTLGQETIRQLLADRTTISVVSVSRDELKQKVLRSQIPDKRLTFRIADIRDAEAVNRSIPDLTDTVFHFAALKHVDLGEVHPEEFVKTNVTGSIHIGHACIEKRVQHCVLSSTDKAVDPINAYGMTKGLAEKIFFALNQETTYSRFHVYRWGNVFGSRGSALDGFKDSLRSGKTVDLTDSRMTRFWIRIQDAVRFMLDTYPEASITKAMIPPIKASSVLSLVHELAAAMGISEFNVREVGLRPGEKIHEVLGSLHTPGPGFSSETFGRLTQEELRAMIEESLAS